MPLTDTQRKILRSENWLLKYLHLKNNNKYRKKDNVVCGDRNVFDEFYHIFLQLQKYENSYGAPAFQQIYVRDFNYLSIARFFLLVMLWRDNVTFVTVTQLRDVGIVNFGHVIRITLVVPWRYNVTFVTVTQFSDILAIDVPKKFLLCLVWIFFRIRSWSHTWILISRVRVFSNSDH